MTTKITRSNIASTGVAAGSYSAADITVNSSGQVTSASTSSIAASGGGGPKISGVVVTDNAWTTLDDTAVDVLGGYIKITGTGFTSGCLVYFNQTPASSVSFVSSTELRVTTGALSAGTYVVYAINTDGGVAISVPGVTFSASPAWQTSSTLSDQYDGVAITLDLVAQEATSYTLVSGSLPPGLSLNSSTGAITGTVVGVTVDTSYTFTVRATDAQNQDSPRTFTVTITVSDPHFSKTTLLLSGSAISANTVLRDSSTNNFNLTAFGDARASNFTPYNTGWSVYFDGTGDYLTIPNSVGLAFGTGDFTVEFWAYVPTSEQSNLLPILDNDYNSAGGIAFCIRKSDNLLLLGPQASGQGLNYCGFTANFALETWNHFVVVAHNSVYKAFLNGTQLSTQFGSTVVQNVSRSSGNIEIGRLMGQTSFDFGGYLSNFRVIKGTALYTANFTPATTNLTAITNTSLLTCNANRFLDSSTNNFAITRNGDAKIVSFNPFNITNTGVDGSMYFDGTTDSVRLPSNAISALPGDFTLELWIYLISTANNPVIYLVNASQGLIIYVVSSKVVVRSYGTADLLTSVDNIQINIWTHIAVSRSGSTLSLWLNGSRASGGTITYSTAFPQGEIRIATSELDAKSTNGYIADLRLIKGSAQYNPSNTTITVPTAPLTAIANTQLLTLQYDQPHNNHTFLDASSNQFLITRSGNTTQGTFSPFSQTGWGNYFDGTGDYLSVPDNAAFTMGSGNFTVEAFVFRSTTGARTFVFGQSDGSSDANTSVSTEVSASNKLTTYVTVGTTVYTTAATNNFPSNQWVHIAIVRSGGTISQYINGSLDGQNTTLGTLSINDSPIIFGVGSLGTYAASWWNGYISNFRVVKGVAVYTGAFTPPTSPLAATQSAGTNISAITGTQTSLLTCQSNRFRDASTNNFTITPNGDARVVAFSPFAPTAVYNPVAHGGSAYFDGSGDYLSYGSNATFGFGTADFTVEAWIYISASADFNIFTVGGGADGSYGLYWVGSTSKFESVRYGDPGGSGRTTNTYGIGQWYHIAASRSGGTARLFINGNIDAGSTYAMGSVTATAAETGRTWQGSALNNGYISNLRVITGTALYTANFTPPTAPVTATTNTSLLLNFTDAAILDSTGRNVIETVADARTSSVVTKFTGASMLFDGTGDNLVVPSSTLMEFGLGNFTIEFWFYKTANGSIGDSLGEFLIRIGDTAATVNSLIISTNNSQQIGGYIAYSGGAWTTSITSSSTFALNTWHHVAFVRTGTGSNQTILYVNGVNVGTGTSSTNLTAASYGTQTRIGSSASDRNFNGYIQDLRVTRYARYTSNFTPPTVSHRLK